MFNLSLTQRAAGLLRDLVRTGGEGPHLLSVSTVVDEVPGSVTVPVAYLDGEVLADSGDLWDGVAALAVALDGAGGRAFLRSLNCTDDPEKFTVMGWSLYPGGVTALSGAEVYAAARTDQESGELLPPQEGVAYREATFG